MALNEETYLDSSQKRPPRITSGGPGIYCCVPQCSSASYDKHKQKSGIGFFKFPENVALFKVWKKTIGQYRRKGGADTFEIKKTTRICEFHFQAKEIKVSLGVGRKTLVEGAVPSIFPSKRKEERPTRKPPADRKSNISVAARIGQVVEGGETEMDIEEPTFEITSSIAFACDECKKHEAMITDLKEENEAIRKENVELKAEKSLTNFSVDNISMKEQLFKSLTDLRNTCFENLWNFVDPREHCGKSMFYDATRRGDDIVSLGRSEENKRGRKPILTCRSVSYVPCVVKK